MKLLGNKSSLLRRLAAGLAVTTVAGAGVVVGSASPAAAACGDGSFNAEAVLSGSTWTARNAGRTVYTGSDMRSAVQAALRAAAP